MIVTVGYEGRSADEIGEMLDDHLVDVLVDVRLNATSRKVDFRKNVLAETLAMYGVGYRHVPALGNPKENRAGFVAGDEKALARFGRILDEVEGPLAELVGLLDAGVVVGLLCFEADSATCHRSMVVERLLRMRPCLQVLDL